MKKEHDKRCFKSLKRPGVFSMKNMNANLTIRANPGLLIGLAKELLGDINWSDSVLVLSQDPTEIEYFNWGQ